VMRLDPAFRKTHWPSPALAALVDEQK